jgi:hypothetical protein
MFLIYFHAGKLLCMMKTGLFRQIIHFAGGGDMKQLIVVVALLIMATPAFATKACEELKSEIDAKIQANGVKAYTLAIVPNEQVKEGKVVGSCDGGTKKIIYTRGK